MRFTPLYFSVLAVTIGISSASPIAIANAEKSSDSPLAHIRLGFPVGQRDVQNQHQARQLLDTLDELEKPRHKSDNTVPLQPIPLLPLTIVESGVRPIPPEQRIRRPCAGAMSRFRQKSVDISNMFRQALGMPVIEVKAVHWKTERLPNGVQIVKLDAHGRHGGHHGRHGHIRHHHRQRGPFMMRLHNALMSLGPWEGRAVAFVLGCGIGVLIRMMWVLIVVAYRAVKGGNNEEEQNDGYLRLEGADVDAEEIFVAPPQYVVDEKAPLDGDRN